MSLGTTSLTILSEKQKFNGENLPQWNITMTQLLGSKGLIGYIDRQIVKPAQLTITVKVLSLSLSLPFVICYFLFVYMHYGMTFIVDTCFSLLVMFTEFYDVLYCSI